MDSIALQLDRLKSPNKAKRFDACEELRLTPQLSPEAILALEQASDDPDLDVADAAHRALLAHSQERADFVSQAGSIEAAPVQADAATRVHEAMLKEIRSWGFWSLALGVMHVIGSSFLSAPWGLLLIVVGLGSFYFRTASMFVVYGVTMAWAALWNLIGGAGGWNLFALLQVYFAVRLFQQFRRFRKAEVEFLGDAADEPEIPAFSAGRTARLFPWLGLLLGGLSLFGLLGVWAAVVIITGLSQGMADLEFLGLIEGLVVAFGVLGLALALASLLCNYRQKLAAILGLAAGVLVMVLELGLYLVSRW